MTAGSRRRYRLVRALIAVGVLLPFVLAGVGSAEQASTATPAAPAPSAGAALPAAAPDTPGITPGAVRLRLGGFAAPAPDAVARTGVPGDVPLAADFPGRDTAHALTLTRDNLAPFKAVGVTWLGGGGPVSVAVRGRTGGESWGPWQAAGTAGGFDSVRTGVRDGAQLLWLGASDSVQVTVAAGDRAPEDVTVDLIDPREAPGDEVPVPPVTTTSVDASRVGRPPIHTRAEWGADERLMSWLPQYTPNVRALAWHDQPVGGDYAEMDVPPILRALYYYQAVSRGWGDLGDNVVVDRFGRLWEGRYGGLSRGVVGAHTPGHNTETAGIGVLGGASSVQVDTVEAAARYVAWKFSIGPAVDPRGDARLPVVAPPPAPAPARSRVDAAPAVQPPVAALPPQAGRPQAGPPPAARPQPPADHAAPPPVAAPAPRPPGGRTEATRAPAPEPTKKATTAPTATTVPKVTKPAAKPTATRPPVVTPTVAPPRAAAVPAAPAPKATKSTAKPKPKPKVKTRTKIRRPAYPKKPAPPPAVTVPRVFAADRAVAAPALPEVRSRAYALMGSWSRPETMRRTLATWNPATATFTVLGDARPVAAGSPGDLPVPADYDGDGARDMATWTPASGTWTIHNSVAGTTERIELGQAGDLPVPADFDGDGRAEPATFNPTTATWRVRGVPAIVYGQPGDQPVAADYTGDGRADLAVYRPSVGTWDINGVGRIRLGDAWNVPVPADYDGDGRVDPATWSTKSQRWFVQGRDPVTFGLRGDLPVPGQYDGDGKADFAVWRPGGWYVRDVGTYPLGTLGDIPAALG